MVKKVKLEEFIEDLDLDELDESEIDRVVAGISREGLEMRRRRKGVRYKLYRIRNEVEGGCASDVDSDFKKQFEEQDDFDGWRFFSINWDVAMDDPFRIVHRVRSVNEEWEELIQAKFPRIEPGGKIVYPDVNVRKKVDAEQKVQKKTAKKKAVRKKAAKKS